MAGRGRRRLIGTIVRLGAAGVILGLGACAAPPRAERPACTRALSATLPLDLTSEFAVVPGQLNDAPARYVLDTGAEASHVTPWAVERYDLPLSRSAPTEVTGLGGVLLAPNVEAEITLGGRRTRATMPVVALPIRPGEGVPFAGLLGADLLSGYDVEISLPERQVRLWTIAGCTGDPTGWAGLHWPIPLGRTPGGRLQVPVVLDGRPVDALLDTGANVTVLGAAGADRLGLTPARLANDRAGRGRGVDGVLMRSRLHRFGTMAIGPELFEQPRLVVSATAFPEADMLLGLDWFRDRRVWISWAGRTMFVQPEQAIGAGNAAAAAP